MHQRQALLPEWFSNLPVREEDAETMKLYGYTPEEVAMAKEVIITYPWYGSLHLTVKKVVDGYVEGLVWDDSMAGSPYYPDDYRGEYDYMNFPISCVRQVLR